MNYVNQIVVVQLLMNKKNIKKSKITVHHLYTHKHR